MFNDTVKPSVISGGVVVAVGALPGWPRRHYGRVELTQNDPGAGHRGRSHRDRAGQETER